MPVRKKCPEGLNRDGIAEAPEAAMSSGYIKQFGRFQGFARMGICL